LEDDTLVAAGGIVKIANGNMVNKGYVQTENLPKLFIEMCQVIEYNRSFNAFRIGLGSINSILIIPGTLGIFKKDLLQKIGGYSVETIGEDMEIILRIHRYMKQKKKKYRISLLCEVECWTQVPSKLAHLKSQRIRWQRGLLDCLIKNKDMAFNPHFGVLGLFGIPYYWIFELLTPLFELMGVLIILISFILGIFLPKFIFTFLLLDILVGIFISISALLIDNYRKSYSKNSITNFPRLILYCILENFGYRQLINWWRLVAFWGYKYKGNLWGTTIRKSY
jgi:cellulose synthase/poly-beta-1,6-N-acetylglucosamine synthase-like glycosyltransferase